MRPAETMPAPATTLPAPPEGDEVLAPLPTMIEWDEEHSLVDPVATALECDEEWPLFVAERAAASLAHQVVADAFGMREVA